MTEPAKNVCILQDDDLSAWVVSVCSGPGHRQKLGRFATKGEAAEFAFAERDRRRAAGEGELVIHLPDDCPCLKNPM